LKSLFQKIKSTFPSGKKSESFKRPSVSVLISPYQSSKIIMSFSKKIVNLMEKEVSKKVGEYMMMYFQWNREKFNSSQESDETKMEEIDRVKMEAFVNEFMKEHPFVLEEEKKMGRPRAKKETIVEVSGQLSDITDGTVTAGDKPKKEKVAKEPKVKVPKEPKVKEKKEKPVKVPKEKVVKEKKEKPVKEKKEKPVKEKKEKPVKEKKEKPVKEKKEKPVKEKKMTKKEEKDALKAAAEAVMKAVVESVEDEYAQFATQSPAQSPRSPSSGNGNDDEEEEEEYQQSPEDQEMNSLLEEVTQLNNTLEEVLQSGKEGGKSREAFIHEGEDYYVDLEMTIEDEGKTYNPIKKAATGAIVGRASGKTKEMFAEDEDDEDDEEDEDDEDDEEDEDD
jgi:hypothetical protein